MQEKKLDISPFLYILLIITVFALAIQRTKKEISTNLCTSSLLYVYILPSFIKLYTDMAKKRKLNSKNPRYHKVDDNAPKILKKKLNWIYFTSFANVFRGAKRRAPPKHSLAVFPIFYKLLLFSLSVILYNTSDTLTNFKSIYLNLL